MSARRAALAARRERLVAQAAAQRAALARDLAPWRAPLALADRGLAALRYLKRHPALLVGVTVAFAAWRPKRVGHGLGRAWRMWRLARRLFGP
jgi:hypothetical protein